MRNLVKKLLLGALIVVSTAFVSCKPAVVEPPANYAPEFTSDPLTEVTEGSSVSRYSNATDPEGDKLTHSFLLAPPEVSIHPDTGLLTVTAPQIDADTPYDIIEGISDGINPVVTRDYTLIVKNVPESPIPVFSGKPTVQVESGNVPLEDLVSYSGSVTNGTVVKQEIGADLNYDGNLGDGEIIETSTSAIKDKKIIFTQPGTYQIYGRSTDDKGNIGLSEPTAVTISPTISNPDLEATMTFPDTYTIGSKFTFDGQIKNKGTSDETIDVSQEDNLEYRLIKEIIPGIGEEVLNQKFQDNLKIILKSSGYFGIKQIRKGDTLYDKPLENDSFVLTISPQDTDIIWNGVNRTSVFHLVYPEGYPTPSPCYKFIKSGNYRIAISIKDNDFNYLSDPFNVNSIN
ncbi:MAG: hypothetical protein Q7S06_02340 [Nanoarchaeota archaeon]|nr:hypothetical protein [Nanoarchaeota archaeon]